MTDESEVSDCYRRLYDGMVRKDMSVLDSVLDGSFVLVHMTGMRQPRAEFMEAVRDGTLNYYSAEHVGIEPAVDGDVATLEGRSMVNAAVFGGGRHTWRLRLDLRLVRRDGAWRISEAVASTF